MNARRRRGRRSTGPIGPFAMLVLVGALAGCAPSPPEPPAGCPRTIAEARAVTADRDVFIGGGYLIRFVPSADPQYRGYDVNITTPISPERFINTAFLRVATEVPDVSDGDPVLLIGPRERGRLVRPGACPPLSVVDEEELDQ